MPNPKSRLSHPYVRTPNPACQPAYAHVRTPTLSPQTSHALRYCAVLPHQASAQRRRAPRAAHHLDADAISLTDFTPWGCNDYVLADVDAGGDSRCYVALSPRDVVIAKRHDRQDHVAWLVEWKRYEALLEVEWLEEDGHEQDGGGECIQHLVNDGEFVNAARLTPKVLLMDHIHSIPVGRVVEQLQSRPYFLFLYLDALIEKEPHGDRVRGYAGQIIRRAYHICDELALVLEMVFLLGRMGNNKQALTLTLIIERLGDVHQAIDFAKEQNDDLWEDLLKYSETRPTFISGLLKNIGAEIRPLRLIRRIKNGLEIPGLQEALIKILQEFHLQI
ncbi:hypothetical protein DFH07DRAFT_981369 [Mycena maculata]|uniref:Uncharacterized protein n=1 Tax=Mycena maculata TaxID=230809 RepID=A0AAD7IEW6_9AGAR|nr:hypothetical protein DFH07DRAFT_981369 [Mycena maculata]